MGEIKELAEIEVFVADITCLIIREVRQHIGKPKDIIIDILKGLIEKKIRDEGVAAFSGLGNIPEELKNAGADGWLGFAITALGDLVPKIIDAITVDVSLPPQA